MARFQSEMGFDDDPEFDPQQLAYDAFEARDAGNIQQAVEFAVKAVELNPDCVDARMLLAQIDPRNDDTQIEEMAEVVERGAAALGKRFFKENEGWFWGLLETRPYMRARAYLAELLAEAGRRDEAITHYEEMLQLNPNDNQGLRYILLGHYLVIGRADGARRLFEQYPDEGSAMFAWSRVLERFLAEDLDGASTALQAAHASNRHVETYLTGKKKLPKESPGYYSPGEETEAVVCMIEIGEAWRRQPAAIEWLKRHSAAARPSRRAR